MSFFYAVFARVKFSYLGFLILDHLAAYGAGLTGGQVAVVAVGQVDANFLGSLHLEAVHSFPSLGNVDLVVVLVAHFVSLLLFRHTVVCLLSWKVRRFSRKHFSFRNHSFAFSRENIIVSLRKMTQKMESRRTHACFLQMLFGMLLFCERHNSARSSAYCYVCRWCRRTLCGRGYCRRCRRCRPRSCRLPGCSPGAAGSACRRHRWLMSQGDEVFPCVSAIHNVTLLEFV